MLQVSGWLLLLGVTLCYPLSVVLKTHYNEFNARVGMLEIKRMLRPVPVLWESIDDYVNEYEHQFVPTSLDIIFRIRKQKCIISVDFVSFSQKCFAHLQKVVHCVRWKWCKDCGLQSPHGLPPVMWPAWKVWRPQTCDWNQQASMHLRKRYATFSIFSKLLRYSKNDKQTRWMYKFKDSNYFYNSSIVCFCKENQLISLTRFFKSFRLSFLQK